MKSKKITKIFLTFSKIKVNKKIKKKKKKGAQYVYIYEEKKRNQ